MKNDRTGQIYSGKFSISVVDLKHIDLATTEDKQKHRDLWASFFKANSWEELIMLAKQDSNIKKAATAVYTLTQDEIFRQQCEAREDFLRQQIDHDAWFENKFKAQEAALAKQEATLAKQEATIATQEATIATLTETLAEHDAKHEEELKKQSAQHDKELKKRDATISALQTSLSDLRQTVLELQQQITT
jgi:predicted RNase H-like nuclease (RuvC/YqgF family)